MLFTLANILLIYRKTTTEVLRMECTMSPWLFPMLTSMLVVSVSLSRNAGLQQFKETPVKQQQFSLHLKKKKRRWYYHLNLGVHHLILMQETKRYSVAVFVSFKTWMKNSTANSAGLNLWSFRLIKPCGLHWLEANILCGFVWVFNKKKINKYPDWVHYSRFCSFLSAMPDPNVSICYIEKFCMVWGCLRFVL